MPSVSDERHRQRPKGPRPFGLRLKWPAEASESLAVLPIHPALPSYHPAIFPRSAARAVMEYGP